MGLELSIHLAPPAQLDWSAIAPILIRTGLSFKLLLIDNQPAFPDEVPELPWRELQIGTNAGPITLREKAPGQWACIVWGNASADLQAARDRVAYACTLSAEGTIGEPGGDSHPFDFALARGIVLA